MFLLRETPMVPDLNYACCDVRDVARAHIVAMKEPRAAGNRHIITYRPSYWFTSMCKDLADEFSKYGGLSHAIYRCPTRLVFYVYFQISQSTLLTAGYRVPTTKAPYAVLWMSSCFDKTIKTTLPTIGKLQDLDDGRVS